LFTTLSGKARKKKLSVDQADKELGRLMEMADFGDSAKTLGGKYQRELSAVIPREYSELTLFGVYMKLFEWVDVGHEYFRKIDTAESVALTSLSKVFA